MAKPSAVKAQAAPPYRRCAHPSRVPATRLPPACRQGRLRSWHDAVLTRPGQSRQLAIAAVLRAGPAMDGCVLHRLRLLRRTTTIRRAPAPGHLERLQELHPLIARLLISQPGVGDRPRGPAELTRRECAMSVALGRGLSTCRSPLNLSIARDNRQDSRVTCTGQTRAPIPRAGRDHRSSPANTVCSDRRHALTSSAGSQLSCGYRPESSISYRSTPITALVGRES